MIHLVTLYVAATQASQPSPTCIQRRGPVPGGATFEARGPRSGPLRLSLYLPPTIGRGQPIVATLLLEDESDGAIALLSNDNPSGIDYGFTVTEAGSGRPIVKRPDYVAAITRISGETVSPDCPAYQTASLSERYDLPVGRYFVEATRTPTQFFGFRLPLRIKKLPVVKSNIVTLTVL